MGLRLIVAAVLANVSIAVAQQTTAAVTAFVDVAVVPMDSERVLLGQTVIVDGARIRALGPSSEVSVPAGAVRVDARGKFLLPGLADMHAHLGGGTTFVRFQLDSLAAEQRLFLGLASGVTTFRSMDHTPGMVSLGVPSGVRMRARAATGAIWSPHIYTAGVLSGPDAGALRAEDVAAAVAAYKAAGYDFVKIHSSFRHGDVFDTLVASARRAGLPIDGHVNGVTTLARALQAYRSIEHLTGYQEAASRRDSAGNLRVDSLGIPLIDIDPAKVIELAAATQRAGVWNCPTLYNTVRGVDVFGAEYLAFSRTMVKALQDAGAPLLLGTDRMHTAKIWYRGSTERVDADRLFELIYGDPDAVHHELAALVDAGLTPYQALVTGTRNVAAFFKALDTSGTIAVGKRADVILLNGNPLADIQNTVRPAGVMIGGRWLPREELDRRIADMKASVRARCPSFVMVTGDKPVCE